MLVDPGGVFLTSSEHHFPIILRESVTEVYTTPDPKVEIIAVGVTQHGELVALVCNHDIFFTCLFE